MASAVTSTRNWPWRNSTPSSPNYAPPNLAAPDGGLLCLALTPDESQGLGFVSANRDSCHITRAIKNHEALLRNNPRTEWDYVVLQSWRDVSEQPNQGYERYATKLAEIVKTQGAEVILYMTSPETQNQDPVTEPYNVASAERDTAVGLRMAKALQPKAVIPVPLAIKNIQTGDADKPGTDLVFRYQNDGHPNQTCAFLVANLFYAALTGKSPEGLEFDTVVETKAKDGKDPDGGELKVVFEGEEKAYLQRMAWEAVVEFDAALPPAVPAARSTPQTPTVIR